MFWSGQTYNLPRGKNQVGLNGMAPFTNIWPFLNITKIAGGAVTMGITPAFSSVTWNSGTGLATFTTVNNQGFYTGTPQSGWTVAIQNVSPAGYNGSFNNATITGANTLTIPMANPGSPTGTNGGGWQAVFTLSTNTPPNTPGSALGQGNNINQYFDVNGDIQPSIPDLNYFNRIYYQPPPNGAPFPSGYTRVGQSLTVDWTGHSTIVGGVDGTTGSGNAVTIASLPAGYDTGSHYFVFFFANDTERADPPKNIRLYLTANQAAINAGQIFEPAYVSMLKQGAGVIRFMDWMSTNGSTVISTGGIANEAYSVWGGGGPQNVPNVSYGMPISVITKLANATDKHPWINVPTMLGTPKFAFIAGMTRSISAGGTTIVKTTYAHNFIAGDVVIPYLIDGNGTSVGGSGGWGQQATVTITPGTATVSWPGHAFVDGQNVWFTGGIGTITVSGQPFNINQRSFYVKNSNVGAGTFQLAGTLGGSVVTLTGTSSGTIFGVSEFDRNAFTVGSNNLTATTFEINCDSTNFGATLPTTGYLTSPFSLSGMTTQIGNFVSTIKSQLNGQLVPRFQWGNELWNGIFNQASWLPAQAHNFVDGSGNPSFWSDSGANMQGYLDSHVMKTIRDVYGGSAGRSRWHGILGLWTGQPNWTTPVQAGITYYLANFAPASGLGITDLYNDTAATGYYGGNTFIGNGDQGFSYSNVTISIGANATVKAASGTIGMPVGTPIIFSNSGGALPTGITAWSVSTPPAYSTGVYWTTSLDTGSGATFTATNNNGVLGANVTTSGTQSGTQTMKAGYGSLVTNWMNDSNAHFINQDGNYPTKYSYFNTMVNLNVGDSRFNATAFSVAGQAAAWSGCIVSGLGMVQYEGGNGAAGTNLSSLPNGNIYTLDPQFLEYFPNAFGTPEDATNWTGMVTAFVQFGINNSITTSYPSKFTDATNVGFSTQIVASFGANYYVDHFQGVGTGVPGNPLWNAIVGTN